MYAAIAFLILAWLFGKNVFRAIRWLVFGSIFAIIGLFVLAQFLPDPPKPTAAVVAPTPRPNYGFSPTGVSVWSTKRQFLAQVTDP